MFLKAEKNLMNAEQIKDEIRKLNRIGKTEVYRWVDEEAAADLLLRIGAPGNPDHLKKRERLNPSP